MTELEVLEQELLKPTDALINDIAKIDGDIILLGVGGKMGPSMAKLARRAITQAGINKKNKNERLLCTVYFLIPKKTKRMVQREKKKKRTW